MSLVGGDGFDMYNGTGTGTGLQARWTLSSTGTVSMVSGRFGGQALNFQSWNTTITRPFTPGVTSYSSFTIGFAMKVTAAPTIGPNATINLAGSGAVNLQIAVSTAMQLSIYRSTSNTNVGVGGALLGTSSTTLVVGTWHYFELEVVMGNGTGRCSLYMDNNSSAILNLTSINNEGSNANCDSVWIGENANDNRLGSYQIDDMYFSNSATRLGEMRCEVLRPTANSSVTWTPLTGNNWSEVNETLVDGDTSYVQTGTVSNTDLYTLGSLSLTPTAIYGVQPVIFAEDTDATAHTLNLVIKSGSTTDSGSAVSLTNGLYQRFERMLVNDPNTSAAWTLSAVNALLTGPNLAS